MHIINKVANHIKDLYAQRLADTLVYHNLKHTQRVVRKVQELTLGENCNDQDTRMLIVAAWFHDVGFLYRYTNNEPLGAEEAVRYLVSIGVDEAFVETVRKLILVTQMNVQPQTHLEKIMKDADCSHLASAYYFEVAELLRKELELVKDEQIDTLEWEKENAVFFEKHTFFTPTAHALWHEQKKTNYERLRKRIEKKQGKLMMQEKNAVKKTGRGVETMFRVTLKNHIELSSIADTKANILLSVNSIIISVVLATLVPKLDSPSNAFLILPTLALLIFSVLTVVLCVLSTRPNVSKGNATREKIAQKETNILFFGNFYKMERADFEWGINHLIENEDVLYDSLTKDLYYLGKVLHRKYKMLRIAYTVFMFGIVISALAYIASFYFLSHIQS